MNGHTRRHRVALQTSTVLFLLTVSIVGALLLTCAEIVPPPGGEVDRTGPTLTASSPANGALSVPPGREIVLYFSEPVTKPATGSAVYISPRPSSDPKIKWKSDRVIIEMPDSFLTDQTYIVTVASTIMDLRKNKLDAAATIAFSTGTVIDSGAISGHLFMENGKPGTGVLVGLYDIPEINENTVLDSLYPTYVASTDKDGYFTFKYLPERTVQLIGFVDRNKDERFNPLREKFALPDRMIEIGGVTPLDELDMILTSIDTSRVEILTASFSKDRMLKVRMSQSVSIESADEFSRSAVLVSDKDSTVTYRAHAFVESGETTSDAFTFYFGEVPDGGYSLRMNLDQAPVLYQGIPVVKAEDKTRPGVVAFSPEDKPGFLKDIEIGFVFSEPVDTSRFTGSSLLLRDGNDTPVPLELSWRDQLHLDVAPEKLVPGSSYLLSVTDFDIVDLAGNVLGDSLSEYGFSVLDADSLGSISGVISIALEDRAGDQVSLVFSKVGRNQTYELTSDTGAFKIEVPAGDYILSGFIDSDGDGVRDPGSIFPFELSETAATLADTISVRARFETAEVQFEFR